MGGSHDHAHGGTSNRSALTIVLALTTMFLLVEVIGAMVTGSLALLSDAAHMLTDVAALALSLLALWFATKPPNPRKTFGYLRAEVLAAFINAATLVLTAAYIFYEAYERILEPPSINGAGVTLVATGGLAVNLIGAWILTRGDRSKNLNVRGALLHVVGDAIGSVGAIIAGGIIYYTGWVLIDPIISVLIALLVLFSSYRLLRESVDILMEGTPPHIDTAGVKKALLSVRGVKDIHDLHIWSVTPSLVSLSCHAVVEDTVNNQDTLEQLNQQLRSDFGIDHTTIQLETKDMKGSELQV
jgi:cobalt-zinc-cadmium efflux system protein